MSAANDGAGKQLVIQQVRSAIGYHDKQRRILRSLGLVRLNQKVTITASPSVLGMVNKVRHLVRVVED